MITIYVSLTTAKRLITYLAGILITDPTENVLNIKFQIGIFINNASTKYFGEILPNLCNRTR